MILKLGRPEEPPLLPGSWALTEDSTVTKFSRVSWSSHALESMVLLPGPLGPQPCPPPQGPADPDAALVGGSPPTIGPAVLTCTQGSRWEARENELAGGWGGGGDTTEHPPSQRGPASSLSRGESEPAPSLYNV